MASSPVNVPNPVTAPTAVQLAQSAANIAGVVQQGCIQGQYLDVYDAIADIAAAVNCLAQAGLAVNNTTPSSVGTLTVRSAYALGAAAVVPTIIGTSAV